MKEIKLSKGYVALVDDEDYDFLNQFKWFANVQKCGYVRAIRNKTKDNSHISMHRMILDIHDKTILVDHKDRNPLNNQRYNLRTCNRRENVCNSRSAKNSTSKYLGVSYANSKIKRQTKKSGLKIYCYPTWRATIFKDYKQIDLGRFKTEIDAAIAYNTKAKELHGEFANLNILP